MCDENKSIERIRNAVRELQDALADGNFSQVEMEYIAEYIAKVVLVTGKMLIDKGDKGKN